MPRPLKRGIPGANMIILSKDIDKYAFMYDSILYETDVTLMPSLSSDTKMFVATQIFF